MKQIKGKTQGKLICLLALLPLFSVGVNLLLMRFGMAEGFHPVGLVALALFVLLWGFAGSLFAKNGVTLMRAVLVFHALPLLTTAIYTILEVIGTFAEATTLTVGAEIVGVLGIGVFGIFGTVLYSLIPLAFFEVYLNLIFSALVFAAGFALAPFGCAAGKR